MRKYLLVLSVVGCVAFSTYAVRSNNLFGKTNDAADDSIVIVEEMTEEGLAIPRNGAAPVEVPQEVPEPPFLDKVKESVKAGMEKVGEGIKAAEEKIEEFITPEEDKKANGKEKNGEQGEKKEAASEEKESLKEGAKETAEGVKETVQDAAGKVGEKAKELVTGDKEEESAETSEEAEEGAELIDTPEKHLKHCMQRFLCHLNRCVESHHGMIPEKVVHCMMEEGLRITELEGRPVVILQCLCPPMCCFGKSMAHSGVRWEKMAKDVLPGYCIGAMVTPVPESVRTYQHLKVNEGVWVEFVLPNSPAAKAGIHRGDLILEAVFHQTEDGKKLKKSFQLNDHELLSDVIQEAQGEPMDLLVMCRGNERWVTVTPVERRSLIHNSLLEAIANAEDKLMRDASEKAEESDSEDAQEDEEDEDSDKKAVTNGEKEEKEATSSESEENASEKAPAEKKDTEKSQSTTNGQATETAPQQNNGKDTNETTQESAKPTSRALAEPASQK
ncbi:MAG: PDZ domain-containing protein [Planctomycetia bacterium]|nr:PDZ domain-containing protein [Planctomycetia bacterium]